MAIRVGSTTTSIDAAKEAERKLAEGMEGSLKQKRKFLTKFPSDKVISFKDSMKAANRDKLTLPSEQLQEDLTYDDLLKQDYESSDPEVIPLTPEQEQLQNIGVDNEALAGYMADQYTPKEPDYSKGTPSDLARDFDEERSKEIERQLFAQKAGVQTARDDFAIPALSMIRPDFNRAFNGSAVDFDAINKDGYGLAIERSTLYSKLFNQSELTKEDLLTIHGEGNPSLAFKFKPMTDREAEFYGGAQVKGSFIPAGSEPTYDMAMASVARDEGLQETVDYLLGMTPESDGAIQTVQVDPKTGKALTEPALDPKTGEQLEGRFATKPQIAEGFIPTRKSFTDYMNEHFKKKRISDFTLAGILFDPRGFAAAVKSQVGIWGVNDTLPAGKQVGDAKMAVQVNPRFAALMSLITEKFLYQSQHAMTKELQEGKAAFAKEGDPSVDETPDERVLKEGPEVTLTEQAGLKRTTGNGLLGREIYRAWKRDENLRAGRPQDEYTEHNITQDQFEIIGALAKDMFHQANPHMYKRIDNGVGGFDFNNPTVNLMAPIEYRLTDLGLKLLEAAQESAPDAFMTTEIPPLPAPEEHMPQTELDKIRKRKSTFVRHRTEDQWEQARLNASRTGHVVDTLRRKLSVQVSLPILSSMKRGERIDKRADLFRIGMDKFDGYKGELRKKRVDRGLDPNDTSLDKEIGYNPGYEMEKQITKFLEFLNTTGRYSNKVNYLTFAIQELTSRMHATQTRFNPQIMPWMRWITGGARPPVIKPNSNSNEEFMFKEVIATHFIKDGGDLLPERRILAFDDEYKQFSTNPSGTLFSKLYESGKRIADSLMTPEQDAQYTKALKNIGLTYNTEKTQQRINVPPELQDVPPLDISDELLAMTISKTGKSKDIEGLHMIEAAHEFYRYVEARKAGTSFATNIAVELDGKTHGPASFLALLGAIKAGFRTGVFRMPGAKKKLDDFTIGELIEEGGDLRDAMANFVHQNGEVYASNFLGTGADPELKAKFVTILKLAIQDRENFLKKPPMTLSYGQLLMNLKDAVKDVVLVGDVEKPIQKIVQDPEFIDAVEKKIRAEAIKEGKGDQIKDLKLSVNDVVVNFLHDTLADAIDTELHPGIQEVGQLLRANNVVAMMTNKVMTIKNALGIDSYIGARESIEKDERGELKLVFPSGTGKTTGEVTLYKSQEAGSAERDGRPGGWGRGRIIPAIIQAIDGAWMNMMFTNNYGAIRNEYALPIFDAIKTDVRGAKKIRELANKSWWDAVENYDFMSSLFDGWTAPTIKEFRNKLDKLGSEPVEISPTNDYKGIWHLLHCDNPDHWYAQQHNLGYGDLSLQNLMSIFGDTTEYRNKAGEIVIRKPGKEPGTPVAEYEKGKRNAAITKAKNLFPELVKQIEKGNKTGIGEIRADKLKSFFNAVIGPQGLNLEDRNSKAKKKYNQGKAEFIAEKKTTYKHSKTFQIDQG